MTIPLSAANVGLEQAVTGTNNMTGVLPGDATTPSFNSARHVFEHTAETGNGGGLFLPAEDLLVGNQHAFCTQLWFRSTGTFDYTVAVTSGLGDGTAGTTVDDPTNDLTLASDTGVSGAIVTVNLELLPGQGIRVTTANATSGVSVVAHFCQAHGEGGKLLG